MNQLQDEFFHILVVINYAEKALPQTGALPPEGSRAKST